MLRMFVWYCVVIVCDRWRCLVTTVLRVMFVTYWVKAGIGESFHSNVDCGVFLRRLYSTITVQPCYEFLITVRQCLNCWGWGPRVEPPPKLFSLPPTCCQITYWWSVMDIVRWNVPQLAYDLYHNSGLWELTPRLFFDSSKPSAR